MPRSTWESLIGAVVENRFRLRTLTHSGRDQAEFLADAVTPDARMQAVTVTVIAFPAEDFEEQRSKLERASRLQHPNLLRIVGAGQLPMQGGDLLYLASEPPAQSLADRLKDGPLTDREARALLADVLDGLEFIHGQGLVYSSLGPQTTVRSGTIWKLADFGGLQPVGEVQPLHSDDPYVPPEAAAGRVTPAWDAWSLGTMLREAFEGEPPGPFDAIVRGCLRRDPERRLSLAEVRSMLVERPKRSALWPLAAIAAALVLTAVVLFLRRDVEARAPAVESPPAPVVAKPAPPPLPRPSPMSPARQPAQPAAKPAQPPATAPVETAPAPAAAVSAPAPDPAAAPAATTPAAPPDTEEGTADYASPQMDGRATASGEPFDSNALTAASRTYPLGTKLRVTNARNGKSVVVRVNDRGVSGRGRVIRLTERAARELGFASAGSARVRIEVVE